MKKYAVLYFILILPLTVFVFNSCAKEIKKKDIGLQLTLLANFVPGKAMSACGPWWFYSFIFQFYLVFPLMIRIADAGLMHFILRRSLRYRSSYGGHWTLQVVY